MVGRTAAGCVKFCGRINAKQCCMLPNIRALSVVSAGVWVSDMPHNNIFSAVN